MYSYNAMRDVLIMSWCHTIRFPDSELFSKLTTGAHDAAAARFAEGLLMDLLEPRWLGYPLVNIQKAMENPHL